MRQAAAKSLIVAGRHVRPAATATAAARPVCVSLCVCAYAMTTDCEQQYSPSLPSLLLFPLSRSRSTRDTCTSERRPVCPVRGCSRSGGESPAYGFPFSFTGLFGFDPLSPLLSHSSLNFCSLSLPLFRDLWYAPEIRERGLHADLAATAGEQRLTNSPSVSFDCTAVHAGRLSRAVVSPVFHH